MPDHIYISFINWCEGEIHLRKCDVSHKDEVQVVADIVYDDDYNDMDVTNLVLGKDCLKKNGFLASSEKEAFMICHEQINHHSWGPTWNKLYARAGESRREALENQKRMLEHQIRQFKEWQEIAENLISEIDAEFEDYDFIKTYDTRWEDVDDRNPMMVIAHAAKED